MNKQYTTGGPKCPNHKCPLLKTGDQKGRKQKWQCPISEALFDVEVDEMDKKEVQDKFGNKQTAYLISEGEGVVG